MEYFEIQTPCLMDTLPTLASIIQLCGHSIHGIALLSKPLKGYLTFCDRIPAGDANLACTQTILVPQALQTELEKLFPSATLIAVPDPRAVFIDTIQYLQHANLLKLTSLMPGSPSVSPETKLGECVVVEPGVQIDADVTIGSGTVIRSGTWLQSGVTIGENSVIGTVGINAYVGLDGKRRGFPHLAGVIVGQGTSLGAACVVVRGILSSTRIGAGCIIGNMCNIGHGVEIDEDVWMSAGTLVGGHAKVGVRATIALGCTIRDNTSIGAGANVGMGSVVTKDVRAGYSVFGNPAKRFASISAGPAR